MSQDNPAKLLGVTFTDDEFHLLNGHARRHKMPLRNFVEYMVRAYIDSMRRTHQGAGQKPNPHK